MQDFNWKVCYLVLVNFVTFVAFGVDKRRAVRNKYRISEATLLGLALIGGSAGALAGKYLFHHKTRKAKFFLLVPVFLAVHAALLIWWLF